MSPGGEKSHCSLSRNRACWLVGVFMVLFAPGLFFHQHHQHHRRCRVGDSRELCLRWRPKIELHQRVKKRERKNQTEIWRGKSFLPPQHWLAHEPQSGVLQWPHTHTHTHPPKASLFPPIPLTVTQSQLVGRRLAKTNAGREKKQPLYSIKDSIMDARFLFRWSVSHSRTHFFFLSQNPPRKCCQKCSTKSVLSLLLICTAGSGHYHRYSDGDDSHHNSGSRSFD